MCAAKWNDDGADTYWHKVLGAHPLLSSEETWALIEQAQKDFAEEVAAIRERSKKKEKNPAEEDLAILSAGKKKFPDSPAMRKLLIHNQRFLFKQAKIFLAGLPPEIRQSVDFFDLVQLGNLALSRAALGFDLNRGLQFSTYATWWTRQIMTRTVRNIYFHVRKIPDHVHALRSAWRKFINRIWTPRLDWDEPLAFFDGASLREADDIAGKNDKFVSLDVVLSVGENDDATYTYADCIPDARVVPVDELAAESELSNAVDKLIAEAHLNERERQIIFYCFGFFGPQKTLEEVGKIFEVTSERIRQIKAEALNKMRQANSRVKMNLEQAIDGGSRVIEERDKTEPRLFNTELENRVRRLKYIPTTNELFAILDLAPDKAMPLLEEYKKTFKAAEKSRKMKQIKGRARMRVRQESLFQPAVEGRQLKNPK